MFDLATILGLIAGGGIMTLLYKPLFGDWDGLKEAFFYTIKSDFWSWLDGEFLDDFWNTLKFNIWLGSGILVGFGIQILLS